MATMIWKFVDSPVASPATLLNMNNGSDMDVDMGQTFDISPPALTKVHADSVLTDGSLLTSASYENRILQFSLGLHAPTKALRMLQIKAITDELSKPNNLLMYQPDSSQQPVFFRTYRSDDYKVRNAGGMREVWGVDCAVEAEPFAIGIRRDLAAITVNSDPAAASGNKTVFDISGIVGDSPTPALVQIDNLGASGRAYLSTRSANNPQALNYVYQAEAATLGTDTTVVADGAASGGNRVNVSFSTSASLGARLTFNAPTASDPVALRGRYRVVIRATAITAALNVTLRWTQTSGGDIVYGPQARWDLNPPNWQWIDLGVIEFPSPQQVPTFIGYSAFTTQHAATPLRIDAGRNSGTGGLLIDYIYLLPADERLCAMYQLKDNPSGYLILDGPNEASYGMASGSSPFNTSNRVVDSKQGIVTFAGGLPYLVPNVNQRWYMLHSEAANGTNKNVSISYWPRWREVATA